MLDIFRKHKKKRKQHTEDKQDRNRRALSTTPSVESDITSTPPSTKYQSSVRSLPATAGSHSTPAPSTPAPSTPAPSTPAPSTPASSTPAPSTPAPSTPAPSTPAPSTPAPSTPAPSTPVLSIPAPSTPALSTSATLTPKPRTDLQAAPKTNIVTSSYLPSQELSPAVLAEATQTSSEPVEFRKQSPPETNCQQISLAPPSSHQLPMSSSLSTQISVTSNIPTREAIRPASPPSMMSPRLSSGQFNGTNGVFSPPDSPKAAIRSKGRMLSFSSSRAPSGNFSAMKSTSKRANGGGSYKIGFVQESAMSLKKKSMTELGAGVYQSIGDVSYVKFLEWIRSERLTTLPHKGSRWDKVLIRSLYFAEQLHKFEQAVQAFALDSSSAAAIGYGHAQLLLELSHQNSEALDKAFSVFYKFAMSFSSVLHRSELLSASSEIREQICLLYTDLISLVTDVAIKFYKTANGMTSGSASLDIFELFGETIETFRTRQNTVIELIWESQIENEDFEEGEALEVKVLSRWLASQDRVIAAMNRDHSFATNNQVEFTNLWFLKHLTRFFQSENSFFLVTGQPGAGKSTLAGSIVERLQRPVNRKSFDTLFCSLSPDVPTTATSLAVVKSLLFQLLNLRVGNMGMYYALFRAYHQCRASDDLNTYEEHLWGALADSLQHPVAGSNELVIVVDGLDEIAESTSASIQASGAISPAALLERLVSVTKQGSGVRLITLSSSIKMPSTAKGSHHEISPADIRDDLHSVALRALIHNHHFHGQRPYDQEQILDRIIQTASGSFLHLIMTCEMLNAQKSPDALIKTLESFESSKPSIQDLVLKVFNSLNSTANAKTLFSWVLAAERPLTTDEIHTLFTIDVQRGTLSDKGVNVHETLKSLEPLFTVHEGIVRFKHPIIHSALHDFASQNKIPVPLKESETDLLLRVLTYAKLALKDNKAEPTFDTSDPSTPDKLFHQHRFLEYAVRYWVLHLQQSPLAPKTPGEFKPTSELQKVFPDTTIFPILESHCWDTQLPIPQAVDLHKLAGTVRRTIFTEKHPSVLQTYLSIATSYLHVQNTTEASKYLYLCSTISRSVLSDIHPLSLEIATLFLKVAETQTTTSRTEMTTQREQVLNTLITAYERQYGSTSELVIQTRKLLAELYGTIKEEDRAREVYRLIQDSTISQYGRNSHQARDIKDHLNVTLGRGKDERSIDEYKESWFHEEDDEEAVEILDISSIVDYLRRAEDHISRKEFAMAERSYVELWMEVSSKCRTAQSVDWHEKNIEIATAYSRFLKQQKRETEATAILSTVWQQYQNHQLSFAQSVVSRLTSVAKEMRSMGDHTQALSIFKSADSYYKNSTHEESQASREITQQLSDINTELVKQSLANSSSATETTTTVSESVFQDVFFSIISSNKAVDANTIALAKKLTVQYMDKKDYTAAVKVIHATLQRTWPSFLASSIQDVTMTSTFTQESIELVEHLAECYLQLRQLASVEDTYSRFFRAVLATEKVDESVSQKARTLLIEFYDKHGYADKAISVFQEILVVQRVRLGHSHANTIATLYTLAHRCRSHPRNHGYWLDYYLQVITALNKDSELCHKDALEATLVATTTYWEDRRYAEAVTFYRVLWNTFVRQSKDHQVFSDVKFLEQMYERYYQCLEETKASWSELYKVSKEYRETVIADFGADSSIAVDATLALAQVSQRSEQHASEAISLYEAVSKSSKTTTTKTNISEINQALSSLYQALSSSSSSSSMKADTVQRALSMSESQFQESTRAKGYSHESSLTRLRDLSMLQARQQKTDVATKQITAAVAAIISTETSSQKQIESAASIASTFRAIEQTSTAQSLVQELHRQICGKDSRNASKWSFDLTKSSRTSLAFLASLEYQIRKDSSITFAEIMADLTMEYIYFDSFHLALQNNESLINILLAAAPLRYFLRRNEQQEMVTVVEDQAVGLFVKRDAQDLKTNSKESPRIFIIGILDHLGNGRNKNFNRSVILASNDSVTKLTKAKKFPEAYDIANLGFLYASKHDGYNGPRAISMGFKLASLLAGRDGEKCPDASLHKKMLELSNRIVKKILDICKSLELNFAQIQLYELSHLSALLGEQEDYETLEWLLTKLWQTRDAQRSWPSSVLLNLGRRLICARYLAGRPVKAIRLAEDIAYNMRRAHGPRAPVTIETYELLAQLYTSTGHSYQAQAAKGEKTGGLAQDYFKKAVGVHEDILRVITSEQGAGDEDDDDDLDTAAQLLANEGVNVKQSSNMPKPAAVDALSIADKSAIALKHLHLLKLAYQRLGGWPKAYDEYAHLNAQLFRLFGTDDKWKGVEGTEKWDAKAFGAGKAESQEGGFKGVGNWGLGIDEVVLGEVQQRDGGVLVVQ